MSEINKTKQLENLFIRKITNRKIRRIFAKTEKKSIKKKESPPEKTSKTADAPSVVLLNANRDVDQAKETDLEKKKRDFETGVEWSRQGIEWLSNSSMGLPNFLWFIKYVILSEHKRDMERSARMNWGRWIGEFSGYVLTGQVSMQQALTFIEDMCKRYIPSTVNEKDGEMNEHYMQYAKGMIEEIVYQVSYHQPKNTTLVLERPIFLEIKDITCLFTGFIDFAFIDEHGRLVKWIELKTSYPTPRGFYKKDYKDKSGEVKPEGSRIWANASLPKEPKPFHLSQMSIYANAEKVLGDMLYVVPNQQSTYFSHEDYEDLQWDRLNLELENIKQKALVRQTLLSLSDDPYKILKLIPPEFEHQFFKNIEPKYKQMIYDLYKNKEEKTA